LKPDLGNARTHSKKQVEQIAVSIKQFGFTNPILVDEHGGIIAGHGRLLAAMSLGLTDVPTIELRHLSDIQKRALRLADNKIALNAGWDTDQLRIEIEQISELDVDLDLTMTGFSTGELDVLLEGQADEEDEFVPQLPANPRTKQGDIGICSPHRIGCGDGRDIGFLSSVVGAGAKIDAAVLDPPYNVRINDHANAKGSHREFAMASDETSDDEFRNFLAETLEACAKVARDGSVHFICMDWRHMEDVTSVGGKIYGALPNPCIWNKSNAGMGSVHRFRHDAARSRTLGPGIPRR
jgi:ParB-like nuclease domain